MMGKKIIVAWVCEFSNPLVRENLTFRSLAFENAVRAIMGKPAKIMADFDQWITNGIELMKGYGDLQLHVIAFHKYVKREKYEFAHDGVQYHILKNEDDIRFIPNVFRKLLKIKPDKDYKKNRAAIKQTLASINPDIIHYYGAENPDYSISALDIDSRKTPLLVQLQTLMSAPGFKENYPLPEEQYEYRSAIEKKVIKNASFILSQLALYRKLVKETINPDAVFFDIAFFSEIINVVKCKKIFDFVYFSANIDKAGDLAVEAFILAAKKKKDITMCVIGDYLSEFKEQLEKRLSDNDLLGNVVFTGRLATHEDVIESVQKARFALLPLKVDLVSGTIREAMAVGLPVVTTITPLTPSLNEKRESLLLSETGDNAAMADNMIKLLNDEGFAKSLADNALITYKEQYDNTRFADDLMKTYKAIYNKDYKDLTC